MCEPTRANAKKVLDRLEKAHPDARIYLDFRSPLELLVATVLAAQCTDEKVNEVTPRLWAAFPTARAIAQADPPYGGRLEELLRPTGFFRRKAASVRKLCRVIVEEFGGRVPDNVEDLIRLPGVGRKTANVVLANAMGQQAIAVDTHVQRVSRRIGLARSKVPDKIEKELCEIIPQKRWTRATQLIGTHGRRICMAGKPDCENCPINRLCDYYAAQAAS